MGLLLDEKGVHFDSSTPSALEDILTRHRLDESDILNRARTAMARMKTVHLSKYNAFDPHLPHPLEGKPYVLVIDRPRGMPASSMPARAPAPFVKCWFSHRKNIPVCRF